MANGSNALSFLHTELPEERTTAKRWRLGRRLSKNVSLEEHIMMQYISKLCKEKSKSTAGRSKGKLRELKERMGKCFTAKCVKEKDSSK